MINRNGFAMKSKSIQCGLRQTTKIEKNGNVKISIVQCVSAKGIILKSYSLQFYCNMKTLKQIQREFEKSCQTNQRHIPKQSITLVASIKLLQLYDACMTLVRPFFLWHVVYICSTFFGLKIVTLVMSNM